VATINPNQDYDIIHTLTFSDASGNCPIRLYRGSASATTGTVYYRAGTSGDWTSLSVSGTTTTFPVTSTTMQIAHNWNKSGNDYMTPSFRGATNITSIAISQKSPLAGTMGDFSCVTMLVAVPPSLLSLFQIPAVLQAWGIISCITMLMLLIPHFARCSRYQRSYKRGEFFHGCLCF